MNQSQGSQTWYSQGHVLSELGRYEGALDRYDRVLELKPDSYQAWCDRGYALEHLERYEEAIASFEKAISLAPKFTPAWHGKGLGPVTKSASPPEASCQSLRVTGGPPVAIAGESPRQRPETWTSRPANALVARTS